MKQNDKEIIVRSVSRALGIIEFIIHSEEPPSFTVIQKFTGIPKSSLSNLLKELVNQEYIKYDWDVRGYCLGRRFIIESLIGIYKNDFYTDLIHSVKELSDLIDETTYISLLNKKYIVKCQVPNGASLDGFNVPVESKANNCANKILERYDKNIDIQFSVCKIERIGSISIGACIREENLSFVKLLHTTRVVKQFARKLTDKL